MAIIAIAVGLFSAPAMAIKGIYRDEVNPPNACQLTFIKNTVPVWTCTAVVVGANKLITIGHCAKDSPSDLQLGMAAQDYDSIVYQCPDGELGSVGKKDVQLPSGYGQTWINDPFAIAIITTPAPLKAKAMKMATDFAEAERVSRNVSQCFVSGYGIDNSGVTGRLHTTPNPFSGGAAYFNNLFQAPIDGSIVDHGDSGGPLFCMFGDQWYLVGVIDASLLGLSLNTVMLFGDKVWLLENLGQYADAATLRSKLNSGECEAAARKLRVDGHCNQLSNSACVQNSLRFLRDNFRACYLTLRDLNLVDAATRSGG